MPSRRTDERFSFVALIRWLLGTRCASLARSSLVVALAACRCTPRRPSSSRPRPRPISSRATSRTSRSTAAASCCSARRPSWSTRRPSPFLWAIVPGTDGSLFVGTGNEGKVFRIDAQGKGSSFFDAAELEAHALAPAPDGGLYVGTSPDGKIYKVDRRRHADDVLRAWREVHLGARHRCQRAICTPAPATRASIYKIAPDGKGAPFYQAQGDARHRAGLRQEPAICSSAPSRPAGCCASIPRARRSCCSIRRSRRSARCASTTRAMLYAAAVSGGAGNRLPPRAHRRAALRTAAPSRPAHQWRPCHDRNHVDCSRRRLRRRPRRARRAPDRRAARGAVYRITPDGLWDQLWESRDDSPYDIAFDCRAAADHRHRQPRQDVPARGQSAAADAADPRRRAAGHRVPHGLPRPAVLRHRESGQAVPASAMQRAPRGTYESEPRDAQMVATWGAISWRGTTPSGTDVEISTRSGNTPTPDDTWSAWSPATRIGTVRRSPAQGALSAVARRADRQEATTPILTSVTAAYLQRNLRPEVQSITVHPPGIVFQKPFSTGDPDLAGFENQTTPERKLTNAAMSAQSRQFAVARPAHVSEGAADARLARRRRERRRSRRTKSGTAAKAKRPGRSCAESLGEQILVWDTTTVPNGTYFVKIVASDAPSNAADTALAGEMDSVAFEVDNTPPQIATPKRPDRRLTARGRPSRSPMTTRRSSRSSARRTVSSGGRCSPPTASPIRARSATK